MATKICSFPNFEGPSVEGKLGKIAVSICWSIFYLWIGKKRFSRDEFGIIFDKLIKSSLERFFCQQPMALILFFSLPSWVDSGRSSNIELYFFNSWRKYQLLLTHETLPTRFKLIFLISFEGSFGLPSGKPNSVYRHDLSSAWIFCKGFSGDLFNHFVLFRSLNGLPVWIFKSSYSILPCFLFKEQVLEYFWKSEDGNATWGTHTRNESYDGKLTTLMWPEESCRKLLIGWRNMIGLSMSTIL